MPIYRAPNKSLFITLNEGSKYILHPPEYPRVFAETGLQLIRSQNVRPLGINLSENPVFFSADFLKDKKVIFARRGDVLIVRSGVNAGDVAVIEEAFETAIIGADTLLLRSDDNFIPKFLQVYFHTNFGKRQILRHTTGATNKHLNSENLKKVLIPNVSLEIQRKAISIFEGSIEAKRAKEAEAKAMLDGINTYLLEKLGIETPPKFEKKKTFFTRASKLSGGRFDPFYHQVEFEEFENALQRSKYELEKIGNLCFDVRGVTYSNTDESTEGKKILRANNINLRTNELDLSDIRHIREDFEISDNQHLRKNDIFMCAASGSKEHSGKVAFIEEDTDFYFGAFMVVLRTYENILPKYLFEILASSIFRKFLMKILGGTNINNLNFSMFRSYKIPLPPLSAQNEIAANIQVVRGRAKQLEEDAKAEVEKAKAEVERMILGEVSTE